MPLTGCCTKATEVLLQECTLTFSDTCEQAVLGEGVVREGSLPNPLCGREKLEC